MKMEEKLLTNEAKVAAKPKPKPRTTANNRRPAAKNSKPQPKSQPQTANRQRTAPPGGRTYRR
jgi:hypothetical protein